MTRRSQATLRELVDDLTILAIERPAVLRVLAAVARNKASPFRQQSDNGR